LLSEQKTTKSQNVENSKIAQISKTSKSRSAQKQMTHTTAEWESLAESQTMQMRIPRKLENPKNKKVRVSQKEGCMYFQRESQQFSYLTRFD